MSMLEINRITSYNVCYTKLLRLVVVEHDMAFVGTIARKVTVLHEGSVLAEGALETVQNDPRVIEVYLGR